MFFNQGLVADIQDNPQDNLGIELEVVDLIVFVLIQIIKDDLGKALDGPARRGVYPAAVEVLPQLDEQHSVSGKIVDDCLREDDDLGYVLEGDDDLVEEFSRVPADDGVHEIVLIFEIQVERSLGDPRLFHDLADRCFFHTVGSEQTGRTLFDRIARSGLIPSAGALGFAALEFSHAWLNTFPVDVFVLLSTLCSPNEDDKADMREKGDGNVLNLLTSSAHTLLKVAGKFIS